MASRRTSGAQASPVVIKSIHVENYLGISLLDLELPPRGAVIEGRNTSGKSSVLKAVQAALAARGLSPEAIRVGATKSEIRVDLGDVSVRRVITEAGSTLKVTRPDGAIMPAPQTFLRDLLGVAPLDPIAFWGEGDAKKRRAMLLDALPVTVTPAMLRVWTSGALSDAGIAQAVGVSVAAFSSANEDTPLPGHGLDLVARAHAAVYSARTEQNRAVKYAASSLASEEARLAELALDVGEGLAPSVAAAQEELETASLASSEVEARRRAAIDAQRHRDGLSARAVAWREEARALRANAPGEPSGKVEAISAVERAQVSRNEAEDRVRSLEEALEKARSYLDTRVAGLEGAVAQVRVIESIEAARARAEADAKRIEERAIDAESIASELPAAPTQDEAAAVAQRCSEARASLLRAKIAQARDDKAALCAIAREKLEDERRRAARLDEGARALSTDAPRQLLANTPALAGITIEGDVIRHNGIAIDSLSGAEQMSFAIALARALNARSKILLVDGLEAVDPDALPAFIRQATAGGFQLLAARVATGERRIHPIVEPTAAPAGEAIESAEGAAS